MVAVFPPERWPFSSGIRIWFLIVDDTFVYRASRKAPGSGVYHQHGNKANRPQYARGQCWVSMALSVTRGKKHAAIPLLSRLMRTDGNTGKLDATRVLLRTMARVFTGKKVCLLVDIWYMKYPLIAFVLALGFQVIGQVRRDTALYSLPVATGKRGRPAKYGDKYTPDWASRLRENFTGGSCGEGLETDRKVPRQSLTRQTFFAWWKRHLKVYLLISRSRHGLMIQMLAGLITYTLLAIYCQEQQGEPVSIHRVSQLRNQILNESRMDQFSSQTVQKQGEGPQEIRHASP